MSAVDRLVVKLARVQVDPYLARRGDKIVRVARHVRTVEDWQAGQRAAEEELRAEWPEGTVVETDAGQIAVVVGVDIDEDGKHVQVRVADGGEWSYRPRHLRKVDQPEPPKQGVQLLTSAESNRIYGSWRESREGDQKDALEAWPSYWGFTGMNRYARDRGGVEQFVDEWLAHQPSVRRESILRTVQEHEADMPRLVEGMDAAIASAPPLPRATRVFRSFQPDEPLRVGELYTDAGFMATSINQTASAFFPGLDPAKKVTAEIELPQGMRVAAVSDYEIVLPRNTVFRVESVQDGKVRMVPLPADPLAGLPVKRDPNLGNEATTRPDGVYTGPKFDALSPEQQRAVLIHESAHYRKLDDAYLSDPNADWDLAKFSEFGHVNGQTTPGEIIAEAYAILWSEPEWLDQHAPKLRELVERLARKKGAPLP